MARSRIESLQQFHHYYGPDFGVECPTGSGQFSTILEVAAELSRRLIRLFVRGEDGKRPVLQGYERLGDDPGFDHPLFYEHFDGETGRGLGASHQTGWTGLVGKLLLAREDD